MSPDAPQIELELAVQCVAEKCEARINCQSHVHDSKGTYVLPCARVEGYHDLVQQLDIERFFRGIKQGLPNESPSRFIRTCIHVERLLVAYLHAD